MTDGARGAPFVRALRSGDGAILAELRPPRTHLVGDDAVHEWIDTYHAVRRLTRRGRFVFLTDNAVGTAEEENLSHLEGNLADEADPTRIVPFLTCKHSLSYCMLYAQRAWARGFRALTVLGGDRSVGAPRCVPHAYLLRERIRDQVPGLALGGWANPHRDPVEQARFLDEARHVTDFFLTQIVSHHTAVAVEDLVRALQSRDLSTPGAFGVFYYRSANPATLRRLGDFFPVPRQALAREFEEGAGAEEICARSVKALRDAGAKNIYISNLPIRDAAGLLDRILARVDG